MNLFEALTKREEDEVIINKKWPKSFYINPSSDLCSLNSVYKNGNKHSTNRMLLTKSDYESEDYELAPRKYIEKINETVRKRETFLITKKAFNWWTREYRDGDSFNGLFSHCASLYIGKVIRVNVIFDPDCQKYTLNIINHKGGLTSEMISDLAEIDKKVKKVQKELLAIK